MSSAAWLMAASSWAGAAASMELLGFGRALERRGLRLSAGDREIDRVEVAGPDLALVLDRGVAVPLSRELGLLQLAITGHAALAESAGKLEARIIEAVKAR